MTERVAHVSRISVTYVKPGLDGVREIHIIGLASKLNKQRIHPERLQDLLRIVAVCCEDVIAYQQKGSIISSSKDGCTDSAGTYEEDDGHLTVITTESDSASHQ
jgi:hypothetical protein